MAADEIERFRREMIERTGDIHAGGSIDEATLLREVMNTVGKTGVSGGEDPQLSGGFSFHLWRVPFGRRTGLTIEGTSMSGGRSVSPLPVDDAVVLAPVQDASRRRAVGLRPILDRRCTRRPWNAQVGTAGWPSRPNNRMIVGISPPRGNGGRSSRMWLRTAGRHPRHHRFRRDHPALGWPGALRAIDRHGVRGSCRGDRRSVRRRQVPLPATRSGRSRR